MSSVVLIAHGTGAKREAVKEVRSMLKRKSNAMAEEREALLAGQVAARAPGLP